MFNCIVVGTDGSDTADRAVTQAAELAEAGGASLHLVSAYEPAAVHVGGGAAVRERGDFALGPDYKVDAVLSRAAGRLRGKGVELELHSPKGDPADAILEVAQREDADLIVVGSKGMRGAKRLLGSVPNKVSHHATCDVLIVRTD
jgi:nucleotide-binding universal stress UspA family protein